MGWNSREIGLSLALLLLFSRRRERWHVYEPRVMVYNEKMISPFSPFKRRRVGTGPEGIFLRDNWLYYYYYYFIIIIIIIIVIVIIIIIIVIVIIIKLLVVIVFYGHFLLFITIK